VGHKGQVGTSLGSRIVNTRGRRKKNPASGMPKASRVHVTHADGSTDDVPAYSRKEGARVIAAGERKARRSTPPGATR
jgi:hypothetical protein